MQSTKLKTDLALYGLKIWLTTIFVGPVLAFALNAFCMALGQYDNSFPLAAYLMLCYGYGLFFSLPALVVFMLTITLPDYTGLESKKLRLVILGAALLLLGITFCVLAYEHIMSDIVHNTKLSFAYVFIICFAVFFYSPYEKQGKTT